MEKLLTGSFLGGLQVDFVIPAKSHVYFDKPELPTDFTDFQGNGDLPFIKDNLPLEDDLPSRAPSDYMTSLAAVECELDDTQADVASQQLG